MNIPRCEHCRKLFTVRPDAERNRVMEEHARTCTPKEPTK